MIDKELKALLTIRARRCWELMTKTERNFVRLGIMPHWTHLSGLDGREPFNPNRWPCVAGVADHRDFALALIGCAKADGGMIA